jgi:hypothetical protein
MTITARADRARRPLLPPMPPRMRKVMLTLHVIVSVGWLGIDICFIVLGITGKVTSDPRTRYAVYAALDLIYRTVLIPISVLALLTGLLLALGTVWGLFRYYWVLVKFALTVVAVILALFPLRYMITNAHAELATVPVAQATSVDLGVKGVALVIAPIVGLVLYSTNVILSVFKPWGRTAARR